MATSPARRGRTAFALMLAAAVVGGCALLRPRKASVPVSEVEAAFPALERLGAVVYMRSNNGREPEDCVYFEYARGSFTSKPEDEWCRVFDLLDERRPGGGPEGPVPVAFDDQARADMHAVLAAFDGVGTPLDYMNVVMDADGSMGPDSGFSFDRCVAYWYDPGWRRLPEDIPGESVSEGIDLNWYRTDHCPGR